MTLAARLLPRLVLGGFLAAALVACGPDLASTPSPGVDTAAPTPLILVSPSPAETTAPTVAPTSAPTAAPGSTRCGVTDLKASHGLDEGAAGSVITELVLESNSNCTVETAPSLGLQDKSGNALVTATPPGPGSIQLVAGGAYTTHVRIANWCQPEPAFPVSLVLWIDSEKLVVTGGSFPDGGMPGCLGTDGVHLESTPWVVSP
jgi:hypothetical protein